MSSLETESAVLGLLLTYANLQDEAPVRLSSVHFTTPFHQLVFKTIEHLDAAGQAPDVLVVNAELQRATGRTDTFSPLFALTEHLPSRTRFPDYVLLLHQAWMERRLQEIAADMAHPGERTVLDVLEQSEDALFALGESCVMRELLPIEGDVLAAQQRIQLASAEGRAFTGITTGFEHLDRLTLGFQPSDLIILAARPSQGKTALAVSLTRTIATRFAAQPNPPAIAFFSLEMGRQQIANRLIMQASGLSGEKVRTGVLSSEEQPSLIAAVERLKSLPVYVDDTPSLSVQHLRMKARKLVHRQRVRMIVVDYLQLMTVSLSKNATRENEVAAISRALKCLAKELNVPVLALAQLNREMERGVEGREPRLSDLRESGAIEQDADLVMMLHKPRTSLDPTERELILAKHRNGATGHVLLHFHSPTATFSEPQ